MLKVAVPATMVALLLISLGSTLLPAKPITYWLIGEPVDAHFETVAQGVWILKLLIVIDIAAITGIFLFLSLRQPLHQDPAALRPVWQPITDQKRDVNGVANATWILTTILIVASGLRIFSLNTDLWIDEVLTLVNYVRLPMPAIVTSFYDDNQHMLFSMLARISVVVFGESAWALRLPAVVAGVASIYLAAKVARQVSGNRVAILTAALLCFSWHHIWYSQNARGYTFLLFGTLLATYYLLKALHTGSTRFWVLYAFAIAFSALAHLSAVFVAAGHALVVMSALILGRHPLKDWYAPASGFLLSAWLTLHTYALVLPQVWAFFLPEETAAQDTFIDNPWRSPLWLANEVLRSAQVPLVLDWPSLILVFLATLIACWLFRKRNWLFISVAIVPGILLGVFMLLLGRNLWPRMFFNLSGFVVIFMAMGCFFLGDRLKALLPIRTIVPAWIPGIVLCFLFAQSLPSLYRHPKQDFSGARDFVVENAQDTDTVLGIHMAGKVNQLYYRPSWDVINTLGDLQNHLSVDSATWVIYTLPRYLRRARPDLYNKLQQDSTLVREFPGTLGDGTLIVRRFDQQKLSQP